MAIIHERQIGYSAAPIPTSTRSQTPSQTSSAASSSTLSQRPSQSHSQTSSAVSSSIPSTTASSVPLPPIDAFDFSRNCHDVSQLMSEDWHFDKDQLASVEFGDLKSFLKHSLSGSPPYDQASDVELISWGEEIVENTNYTADLCNGINAAIDGPCKEELCQTIPWTGNPDISGIGMVVGYSLESFLVILYTASFLLRRYRSRSKTNHDSIYQSLLEGNSSGQTLLQKMYQAFQGSSLVLLDAAAWFGFSVQIAALVTVFHFLTQRDQYPSPYAPVLTLHASLLSVYSVYVIFAQIHGPERSMRRQKLRKWYVALLCFLAFVLCATGLGLGISLLHSHAETGTRYEQRCAYKLTPIITNQIVVSIYGLLFWITMTMKSLFGRKLRTRTLSHFTDLLTLSGAFLGLLHNYFSFVYIRQSYNDAAGKSNTDNDWGFGQIISLFTWAPVVIDFVYILLFGLKEGVEGRVNHPLKVDYSRESQKEKDTLRDAEGFLDNVEGRVSLSELRRRSLQAS